MDVADEGSARSDENPKQPNSEANEASTETASDGAGIGAPEGDAVIPAAMERINEDVALTQPVAQQESTRSYFLAQTLENTKTVPIVSANLPLYTGADADIAEPAEGEGEGDDQSGEEGGEDSDESDLPASNIIAADSTVVGSFTYRGITYAVEPGGESVAAVASDYAKLPEAFIEAQTIVLPSAVTADGIDYYSVTRIADNAFASLTSEAASNHVISSEVGEADAVEKSALPIEDREADTDSTDDTEDKEPFMNDDPTGITTLGIPSSITTIDDDAFAGFDTLQYFVVEDGNPAYASYDGVLYNADQTCLLLVPEGRLGAVRVAPSATEVKPEASSHCVSLGAFVADPESAAYQLLSENSFLADSGIAIKTTDEVEEVLYEKPFVDLAAIEASTMDEAEPIAAVSTLSGSSVEKASKYNATNAKTVAVNDVNGGYLQRWWYWNYAMSEPDYTDGDPVPSFTQNTGFSDIYLSAGVAADGNPLLCFRIYGTRSQAIGYEKLYEFYYKAVAYPHHYFQGWNINGSGPLYNCSSNVTGTWDKFYDQNGVPNITVYACFVASPDYTVETVDESKGMIQTTSAHADWMIKKDSRGGIWNTAFPVWNINLFSDGRYEVFIWTDTTRTTKQYWATGAVAPAAGYEFAGWSTSSNGSGASKTNINRSGNNGGGCYYYAAFAPITYKIVYNGNGYTSGSTSDTTGCKYDSDVALRANSFSRTGYTFNEWNTKSDGTGTAYTAGATATKPNLTSTANGTGYLYATWTANTYTISYDGNDATSGSTSNTTGCKYDSDVYLRSNGFSRTGYHFNKWNTKSDGTGTAYTAGATATKPNVTSTNNGTGTLYATWTANTYSISYNGNGNTGGSTASTTGCTYDQDVTLASNGFSRTGYTFNKWNTKSDGTGTSYTAGAKATKPNVTSTNNGTGTLYATWTANTYTITYNGNGNTGGSTSNTTGCKYDSNVVLAANGFSKTGYTFNKWNKKSDGTGTSYTAGAEATKPNVTSTNNGTGTLYATWTANTYKISYQGNTNTGGSTAETTGCKYDSDVTLRDNGFSKTGYTFNKWNTKADGTGTAYTAGAKATKPNLTSDANGTGTLYATWTANPYTITYKGNTNTGGSTTATNATYDENVKLASNGFSKTGYHFKQWNTAANGGGTGYAEGETLTKPNFVAAKNGNKDLYAIWEANSYKIAYNKNGAPSGTTAETPATYDQDVTLAMNGFSWPGHTFKGWNTQADGKGAPYSEGAELTKPNLSTTNNGTKTLYAIWDTDVYGIEYVMNNHGTAPTAPTEWTYGTATKLPDPEKVEGYTFGGWYWDQGCSDGQKASITSTTTGPITVYAKWTKNSWKLSWIYDRDDMVDPEPYSVEYASTFTVRDPGSKAGYKFTGWKATGADTNTYDKGHPYTMPDGDVTFTAQWSAHPYTTVNLSDPYLSEPAAQGAIYYWPEKGYVQSESSTDVKTTGIVTPPNLTRLGYDFLGWYDIEAQNENSDSHKMIDANGDMVKSGAPSPNTDDGAVIWYAHWERTACPVDLVAAYAPSEGEEPFEIVDTDYLSSISRAAFGVEFSKSVENGRIAEDKLPKRTGYTFMGYFTKKNDEVSVANAADGKFNGTRWIDANGALSESNWNEPAEKRMPVTLYAAWRLDECEVTFDVLGNVKPNTERVTVVNEDSLAGMTWYYGKPKDAMTVPSEDTFYRNGYEFGGWYYTKDGTPSGEKVFVSDKLGKPTPVNWDVVKTSVTLYPAWTAKTYTIKFDDNFPKIEGMEDAEKTDKSTTAVYDEPLDLSKFAPEFFPYTFAGWYTTTEQLFEGTHMTENSDGTKRFTPRGMVAQTNPIELHALWKDPGWSNYTLFIKYPGTSEIVESVHKYYFTDTVKFNGTEAPTPVEGYRFEGWVEADSYKDAHDKLASNEPFTEGDTIDGFKPISNWDRFFVAKWSTRPLSVSFSTTPIEANESGESWLRNTDLLENWKDKNGDAGEHLPWSEACKLAGQTGSDMSTGISYDLNMPAFVLPNVTRKGQVFEGWKLQGSNDEPARGIVVDPSTQTGSVDMRDLVYIPVFKDAMYKIVLDANGLGEEKVFENVAYSSEFAFPYPATLHTGSVFACWASDSNTVSDGTETFFPEDTAKLAPAYNELGEMTEFGLAHLADDHNVITLYAVWNTNYNVDVPLFANLAIDTERGDVIAGTNTLQPDPDNEDADAVYRIESIRYEPLKNKEGEDGRYAFERPGTPTDKVYLSVYAGLNTGDATDLEHLLYAENIDKDGGTDGEVTYIDAKGNTAKAKPLLIELGGTTPVLYGRTAPTGQASLVSVTDADAPYGFVTFSQSSPLTIRYGLYFVNEQTRKDFAFGSGKYSWLLPKNDATNKAESIDPGDMNFGRRNAWSGSTVDIAKLHYTVSLVSNAK